MRYYSVDTERCGDPWNSSSIPMHRIPCMQLHMRNSMHTLCVIYETYYMHIRICICICGILCIQYVLQYVLYMRGVETLETAHQFRCIGFRIYASAECYASELMRVSTIDELFQGPPHLSDVYRHAQRHDYWSVLICICSKIIAKLRTHSYRVYLDRKKNYIWTTCMELSEEIID